MKEIVKFDPDNPILRDESIFWNANDTRWDDQGNGETGKLLDMENESYVWCFTGPKRSGKTSFMTYLALKIGYTYGKRIIANYPMAINIRKTDGDIVNIKSEKLDLLKLFEFDGAYTDSLIVLDEAPQVINRLATMTWKNRLLDLYLQKIGHDNISMLYGSQKENLTSGWVDDALRFQTDILVFCRDAATRFHEYKRGAMVLANLLDKSGQWTGYRYDEKPRIFKRRILTEIIWGSFDTHQRFDVFESLRGVQVDLQKTKISDKQEDAIPPYYEQLKQTLQKASKQGKMAITDFYNDIGDLAKKEKDKIGQLLTKAGVKRRGAHLSKFDFSDFDMDCIKL